MMYRASRYRTFLAASAVAIGLGGTARAGSMPGGIVLVAPGEIPSVAAARPAPPAGLTPQSASPTAFPVMRNASLLQSLLKVGDPRTTPILKFDYTTGIAGLFAATFNFTSPSGTQGISLVVTTAGYTTQGTLLFTNPVTAPYFAQPGHWALTQATVQDWNGQQTSYAGARAQALFGGGSSLTVVNSGPVSTTAPAVLSGTVLTPTVSLSNIHPAFHVQMNVVDNTSGVTEPYILIQPPGANYSQTDFYFLPAPVRSGVIDAYAGIYSYEPTGTWTISGYEVCNAARNCFTDSSATDIASLFGTTSFTVTR